MSHKRARDRSIIIGWLVGILCFLPIFAGVFFWSQAEFDAKVRAKLKQWPIHNGRVIAKWQDSVTPDGERAWYQIRFPNFYNHERIASVYLPSGKDVNDSMPVRVNASGAAVVPGAYYGYGHDVRDPTKVYTSGYFMVGNVIIVGIIVNAFLSILLGVGAATWAEARLEDKGHLFKGRLGTR